MDISIRNINLDTDIQGIREAHGDDDHWGSDEACYSSSKTSLENGFFIQVATIDGKVGGRDEKNVGLAEATIDGKIAGRDKKIVGHAEATIDGKIGGYDEKIVGHAEWVISNEPCQRFLYLGMLQVHTEYQKRGVGSKLIDSGAAYAKENGCTFLRTMPNIESGSMIFYHKNGFIETKDRNSTLTLETMSASVESAVRIDKVPFFAVNKLPFMVGLYQHASAHIWKVFNARHEYDRRTVYSYSIGESYINIGAFEPTERASVACWSKALTHELIKEILAVGGSLGYKYLNFCILDENLTCFNSFDYNTSPEHDVFMERLKI